MRPSIRLLAVLVVAAAATPALAAPAKYLIDQNHTQIVFSYNHFGFSNQTGAFHKLSGDLSYDEADPSKGSVSVTIPVENVSTGVPDLDEHLKSPDFFDAAKFPNITFKSTKVEKTGADALKVDGELTIHGVTKPATLNVKVLKAAEHPMKKVPAVGFEVSTTIKRSDFGVSKYVPNVSDEIQIRIGMEAQQPKG
jgi:polyisoprenoid-binding protein YceI